MNYAMERFEQIIAAMSPGCKINKEDLPAHIADYREEKNRIRLRIMEEVFNASDEKVLLLVVDKYQSVFTRLMDQLHTIRKTLKKQDDYYFLAQLLFDSLYELLEFLQQHYGKYFNLQQKMPRVTIEHCVKALEPQVDSLQTALKKWPLDNSLTGHITRPLKNFIHSATITYAETQYANRAVGELLGLDIGTNGAADQLRKKLLSLDYNEPDICGYYIDELDRVTSVEESVQGKLHLLKLHLKAINQVAIISRQSLYPGLPGLKEQLVNWLNEEIYFYGMEQTVSATQTQGAAKEVKIHTSLSVPQLALLFRLLKEEQLITNANQSELLKIVAANFTTLQKEQFSYGHLHGKYYKIEASTKRSLYDILMRLLHLSRKIG